MSLADYCKEEWLLNIHSSIRDQSLGGCMGRMLNVDLTGPSYTNLTLPKFVKDAVEGWSPLDSQAGDW